MYRRTAFVSSLIFAAAAACLSPSPAAASDYPPDYVVEQSCQSSGPVEVCAINRLWGGYPRLVIRYRGDLLATHWGRISAYVRLNGRDGIFPMENVAYTEVLRLNDPIVRRCWVRDSDWTGPLPAPPSGPYGWCDHASIPGGGGSVWEAVPPPRAEQDLFFFARSERGLANAWDVEVAFVSDDGQWDSRNGANYVFRFE